MKKMDFILVSPSRQNNGGAIVLHLLCKLLRDKGYNARILYMDMTKPTKHQRVQAWKNWFSFVRHDITRCIKACVLKNTKYIKNKKYNGYTYTPVKGWRSKIFPIVDDNAIVVYPEVFWGNPLKAKNVVRWFLSFDCFQNNLDAYRDDTLVFTYRKVFNNWELNPTCRTMYLTNFDYSMYKQYNYNQRDGACYIVRKGEKRPDLPCKFDGPVIDNRSEQEIVNIFNKSKYCISYDTQTFYSIIASICGCISIIMLENGKSKSDYVSENDTTYGLAYGNNSEEIEYAIRTRRALIKKIENFKVENNVAVTYFIEECEHWLKKRM